MFVGEYLVIGTGDTEETVAISAINGTDPHLSRPLSRKLTRQPSRSRCRARSAAGVVPKHNADGTVNADGSSDTVLKIFGDINGSGQMVYVEYTCDLAKNVLYRNQMDFDAGVKVAPSVEADPGRERAGQPRQRAVLHLPGRDASATRCS